MWAQERGNERDLNCLTGEKSVIHIGALGWGGLCVIFGWAEQESILFFICN